MVAAVPLLRRKGQVVSEVLVLGGGLAGGAAAVLLSRAGFPVRVLEREPGAHDKVCGEFVSVEAKHDLRQIGLDMDRLGAVHVDRLRLVHGSRRIEAKLPFGARGISRRILDEALLELACESGAQVERGVRVTALEDKKVFTNAGSRQAETIFLATGKHDVRGAKRTGGEERSAYVGFKMHWRPNARGLANLEGFIELILFDGGYAGLQLVAADVMNLCLIVQKQRLAEVGGQWEDLLAELMREPAIARRLEDAEPIFPQPLAIANLPYGYVCDPRTQLSENVFRLGDQAAMTASLTGDGIAGALRSAHLAASCLMLGQTANEYHRKVEQLMSGQIRRAMMLQRATESRHLIAAATRLLSLWPGLLGTLAARTRLPELRPV